MVDRDDNVITETGVLEEAVAAFQQLTQQPLSIVAPVDNGGSIGVSVDATLRLPTGITLDAVIKPGAGQGNTGALIDQLKQAPYPQRTLLVAQYIPPKTANTLRLANVQFLDTAGNAYIHQSPLFICIQGRKPDTVARVVRPGKAFQFAGLKIIYALLQNAGLINQPYRTIAEQAGVALGAIGSVLGDLVSQGFINTCKGSNRTILNKPGLITKWTEAFPLIQRKQHMGTFTTDSPLIWECIDLKGRGWWGGEVAGAYYTRYLSSKDATVYVDKGGMSEVMRALRLRKIKPGEYPDKRIDLYQPFWTGLLSPDGSFVPPVVVMAELIATADPRNLETAQRLYEKYAH